MQYSIFRTRWGWFGLLANQNGLLRTCLPLEDKACVRAGLLPECCDSATSVKSLGDCQDRIKAYFEGERVDFADVKVDLSSCSTFERTVLHTLRGITYGRVTHYTDLAARSGRPRAIRAAANTVAKNPMPLIIPCHRVLRKDGSLGGFSAAGGIKTKKRLLDWEMNID